MQNYVYPPVAEGIPRFAVSEILAEHAELIERLRDLSEDEDVFDERYLPVIERFATFVYLLPASEAHHHRGAGGLLRHGLETAKYILQQAYDRLHGMDMSPQKRKAARERWLFAGFSAAINHDIGKPAADMRVFSVSGNVWDPYASPLAQWFHNLPPQEDRLFITWRREGQDHRRMTMNLINHTLLPNDLSYLHEIEPTLMNQIYQAILGEKTPRNDLVEMLQEADKKSLTQDIQKSNVLADLGPEVRQPLARHFVMAMKRLIDEGSWRPNEPGSTLWVIGSGVYLVFPIMATDISQLLHKDGTPGVPSNEYLLAEILEENGLLATAPNGNRLWRLWPSMIDAGEEGLMALRLKDPRYVMDLIPPAVSGEVLPEGEEQPLPDNQSESAPPPSGKAKEKPKRGMNQEGKRIFNNSSSPTGRGESILSPELPEAPVSTSPGILSEPPSPHDLQTLEGLQEHFAGVGLGGQALMKFAAEIVGRTRCDGQDFKAGPQMLLSWGNHKFTTEGNLPEVIESLVRVGWLVLNGSRRYHEEPGFGKCLKLRERETTLFWQMVWALGHSKETDPEPPTVSLASDTALPENEAIALHEAPKPEVVGFGIDSLESPPENDLFPATEAVPDWVLEVMTLLESNGPLEYNWVKEIATNRLGRKQGIYRLVAKYFVIVDEEDKKIVTARKSSQHVHGDEPLLPYFMNSGE